MSDPPVEAAPAQRRKQPVCQVNATFSGVEDFPLFWQRFSLNRDINVENGYWTSEVEQAQQFARLLTGDAFKYYLGLPTSTQQGITNLLAAFKAKYDVPSSEYTYRQQLAALRRIPNEQLSEFAYRVENLVNKAYPNSQEKDARIIDAFVAGVDPNLARKYYEAEGKKADGSIMSLRELIAFFDRFERIWNIPHDSQACGIQSPPVASPNLEEITRQISALQNQVQNWGNRGRGRGARSNTARQANRRRFSRQGECFYCHASTHFWRDCAVRRRENPNWQPPQWQSSGNKQQAAGLVEGAAGPQPDEEDDLNI